jgi:hypothetical protein
MTGVSDGGMGVAVGASGVSDGVTGISVGVVVIPNIREAYAAGGWAASKINIATKKIMRKVYLCFNIGFPSISQFRMSGE